MEPQAEYTPERPLLSHGARSLPFRITRLIDPVKAEAARPWRRDPAIPARVLQILPGPTSWQTSGNARIQDASDGVAMQQCEPLCQQCEPVCRQCEPLCQQCEPLCQQRRQLRGRSRTDMPTGHVSRPGVWAKRLCPRGGKGEQEATRLFLAGSDCYIVESRALLPLVVG